MAASFFGTPSWHCSTIRYAKPCSFLRSPCPLQSGVKLPERRPSAIVVPLGRGFARLTSTTPPVCSVTPKTQTRFQDFLQSMRQPGADNGTARPLAGVATALRRQDLPRLLMALRRVLDQDGGLETVQPTTRKEIVSMLTPEMVEYATPTWHQSARYSECIVIDWPDQGLSLRWAAAVDDFMNTLHSAKLGLDVFDYQALLRSANGVRSRPVALGLWKKMMLNAIEPDVECYNHFMETILIQEVTRGRVDGDPLTGPASSAADAQYIVNLVQRMRSNGLQPDTDSYCHLMTAFSRDDNMEMISEILFSVWGLDLQTQDGSAATPTTVAKTHYLFPNERLLLTVAEIYGRRNEIGTALLAIDCLSRQYQMRVSPTVWYQMLKWTLLHARANRKRLDPKTNLSGYDKFILLVRTMMGPSYGVEPTPEMLHLLVHAAMGLRLVGSAKCLSPAEAGRSLYLEMVLRDRRMRFRRKPASARMWWALPSEQPACLHHAPRALVNEKHRLRSILHSWAMMLIGHTAPEKAVRNQVDAAALRQWQFQGIPDFLLQWKGFLPRQVDYAVQGGRVDLQFRSELDCVKERRRRGTTNNRALFRWFDLADLERPWELPWELQRAGRLGKVVRHLPLSNGHLQRFAASEEGRTTDSHAEPART